MRKLAVLFHPRCGSTWLMSILSANKNVFASYEILDLNTAIRQRFIPHRDYPFVDYREQIQVIDKFIVKADLSGRALHAFKVAPYQMLSLPNIMYHLTQNDFGFIKLYRENIVQATVSQIAGRKLRAKTGRTNAGGDIEGLGKIRVDRNAFFSRVGSLLREIDRLHVAAKYAGESDMVTFTYESMLADLPAVLQSISELTGVPIEPATPRTPQGRTLVKNLKYRLAESVENFDEMRSWLVGTYLEEFLDE